MATYISGVTDYIPQYQPFQPDFNFFAGVIQKKQQQYDQNWSKLNSLYGKFLNAPLTREDNIKNRDQYYKQSVAAIQKITSMDLSLDQNVQQALQVFSPLYNDKNLIHDMSLTKKAMENFSKLDSLKSCVGEKCDGKYWNEGQLFIQYKLDEYKRASADEALNMSAPDAVPMIDVMGKANELAKEFKPVVQETSQGMYIVTRKNGQLVQVPLYEHFKALIGEDPAVKRMYAVEAYVERENFIRTSESKGISREEADQIYAKDKYEKYQLLVDDSKKMAETQGASLQNQLERVNQFLESIPNVNENHPLVQTKQNLEQQIQVNEVNRRSVTDIANNINNGYAITTPSGLSSTPTSPQYTPQGADAIVAFYKMNGDFMQAAISNSAMGAEVKIKADPVALARMREAGANARAETREKNENARFLKKLELEEKEKTEEALRLNQLQSGTKDVKAEFPDEDAKQVEYSKTVNETEQNIQSVQANTVNGAVKYLNEVSRTNTPDAATAKVILANIKNNRERSGSTGTFAINDVLTAIDPLKEGNEGLLKTSLGNALQSYAGQLRKIDQSIQSAKVEVSKTKQFNQRVVDNVLRNYEEESAITWLEKQGQDMYDLKNLPAEAGIFSVLLHKSVGWLLKPDQESKESAKVKSEMLKTSLLDPDGGLRSPGEIATSLNAKYGKDINIEYYVSGYQVPKRKMKVYYKGQLIQDDLDAPAGGVPSNELSKKQFFESIGEQSFDGLNTVAAQMVSDPQIGLKINPGNPLVSGLGMFATSKDGKLSVNNFKIQGDYKQTPINMSFYGAYQTDIQPILTRVDQDLKGAPKISIGYNPKNLATNTEVEVIKAITQELYNEATNPKSSKSFELSPLVQIGGNIDKRGYWFNNISSEVVNGVVNQFTTNEEEAKSLKEKIVNDGFVIYSNSNDFESSLFDTYDVDPRYNLFLSNTDNNGRFSYQEKNRRGDAELNIGFDPIMQVYNGTVDYKYFDPLKSIYRTNSVSVPIDNDVLANGASFSQILSQFDDIMANVTTANLKNIISPEPVDSE